MDRKTLVKELGTQSLYCEGRSRLYSRVLRALEEDAAGAPRWPDAAVRAWKGRRFAVGWEAPHLLLACMHYWALTGGAPELAAAFPSCGGDAEDPGGAAVAFLNQAPSAFWRKLRTAYVQTNEVDRAVAWMLVAAAAFGARGIPFHLVELGASAGLTLIGDRLAHDCLLSDGSDFPAFASQSWNGPYATASRIGLDRKPLRLSDSRARQWLRACVWADDRARLARLDRAISAFRSLEKGGFGPRMERCAFEEMPRWIGENIAPQADTGLLVFNSIATVYLDDAAYRLLQGEMARTLGRWGGRAFWVEFERPRGADGAMELRVHRADGRGLQTRTLGESQPRPTEFKLNGGWEFLVPREVTRGS
jgi:hypothetical protein